MENTQTKPSFEEVVTIKTMNLPDVGLSFNAKRVGPMNFARLRQANYGLGFRMPIMPELVSLAHASLKNQTYKTAKKVVKTLRNHWLTGNTAAHYFPVGLFVEDNPAIKNGRIVTPTQKELEDRLGSHEEKRVVSNDDGSLRFTNYNFKIGTQTPSELSTNTGIIALVGGEENAEKLAKASEHYRKKPCFWVLEDVDSPQTRVVDLDSLGSLNYNRFDVGANYPEGVNYRCSFGVVK